MMMVRTTAITIAVTTAATTTTKDNNGHGNGDEGDCKGRGCHDDETPAKARSTGSSGDLRRWGRIPSVRNQRRQTIRLDQKCTSAAMRAASTMGTVTARRAPVTLCQQPPLLALAIQAARIKGVSLSALADRDRRPEIDCRAGPARRSLAGCAGNHPGVRTPAAATIEAA